MYLSMYLSGSAPADVRLESFESVEKRSSKQAQEDEDHKLAVNLSQSQDGSGGSNIAGGSSRLAAIYQESESSIYRSTPATSTTSSSPYAAAASNTSSSSSSKYGASSNVTTYTGNESNIARSKFASNKGISRYCTVLPHTLYKLTLYHTISF